MITKDKFLKYYNVQMSGKYNMIMDSGEVMKETHLTKKEYMEIIKNYTIYKTKYIK